MKRKKEKEPKGNEDLILRKEAMNACSLSATETFQLKKASYMLIYHITKKLKFKKRKG